MKKTLCALSALFIFSCNTNSQNKGYAVKTELTKQLKEISGIIAVGNNIWAISDKPHPVFYKLNKKGQLLQQVKLKDRTVSDVEAVTADDKFLYIADVGDNDGNRQQRTIIKVPIAGIGNGSTAEAAGEDIHFTFPEEVMADKKKQNDYDCEAVMSFNDSLYIFTKRRTDDQSELFVIPKTPGTYKARFVSIFNTHGLVTDAAINPSKTEVALIGYDKGHKNPFILFFRNFKGNNFFFGSMERVELSHKKTDWQVEGVTYSGNDMVYFSCEETKDVPATLYGTKRDELVKGKKKK